MQPRDLTKSLKLWWKTLNLCININVYFSEERGSVSFLPNFQMVRIFLGKEELWKSYRPIELPKWHFRGVILTAGWRVEPCSSDWGEPAKTSCSREGWWHFKPSPRCWRQDGHLQTKKYLGHRSRIYWWSVPCLGRETAGRERKLRLISRFPTGCHKQSL